MGGGGVEAGVGVKAAGGGGGVAVWGAIGVAGSVSGGLSVSDLEEGSGSRGFGDESWIERGRTYSVKVAIRAELEGGGALAADEEELGGAAALADSTGD